MSSFLWCMPICRSFGASVGWSPWGPPPVPLWWSRYWWNYEIRIECASRLILRIAIKINDTTYKSTERQTRSGRKLDFRFSSLDLSCTRWRRWPLFPKQLSRKMQTKLRYTAIFSMFPFLGILWSFENHNVSKRHETRKLAMTYVLRTTGGVNNLILQTIEMQTKK